MEGRGQTGWEPCLIYPRHGAGNINWSRPKKQRKKPRHNKILFFLPKEQKRRHSNKTEFLNKCLFTQPNSTGKKKGGGVRLRINHIRKGQEEKVDFHFFQTVKLLCLPHLLVWSRGRPQTPLVSIVAFHLDLPFLILGSFGFAKYLEGEKTY